MVTDDSKPFLAKNKGLGSDEHFRVIKTFKEQRRRRAMEKVVPGGREEQRR